MWHKDNCFKTYKALRCQINDEKIDFKSLILPSRLRIPRQRRHLVLPNPHFWLETYTAALAVQPSSLLVEKIVLDGRMLPQINGSFLLANVICRWVREQGRRRSTLTDHRDDLFSIKFEKLLFYSTCEKGLYFCVTSS